MYKRSREVSFFSNIMPMRYRRKSGRLIIIVCLSPILFPMPPANILNKIIKKDLIPKKHRISMRLNPMVNK